MLKMSMSALALRRQVALTAVILPVGVVNDEDLTEEIVTDAHLDALFGAAPTPADPEKTPTAPTPAEAKTI